MHGRHQPECARMTSGRSAFPSTRGTRPGVRTLRRRNVHAQRLRRRVHRQVAAEDQIPHHPGSAHPREVARAPLHGRALQIGSHANPCRRLIRNIFPATMATGRARIRVAAYRAGAGARDGLWDGSRCRRDSRRRAASVSASRIASEVHLFAVRSIPRTPDAPADAAGRVRGCGKDRVPEMVEDVGVAEEARHADDHRVDGIGDGGGIVFAAAVAHRRRTMRVSARRHAGNRRRSVSRTIRAQASSPPLLEEPARRIVLSSSLRCGWCG